MYILAVLMMNGLSTKESEKKLLMAVSKVKKGQDSVKNEIRQCLYKANPEEQPIQNIPTHIPGIKNQTVTTTAILLNKYQTKNLRKIKVQNKAYKIT